MDKCTKKKNCNCLKHNNIREMKMIEEFYGTEEQFCPEYVAQTESEYLLAFGKVIFQD